MIVAGADRGHKMTPFVRLQFFSILNR